MGGDKIVLLDGAGANGGGAATNGLLSMIPGMFANLIGGNKMDPNLVAALMNGRNNQDGFGGANGWWLWIIVFQLAAYGIAHKNCSVQGFFDKQESFFNKRGSI